ncbi:Aspartate racemase [subsurface metagenome]
MKEKIVGVLGGMGPEATVDIFQKILKSTPAKTDQEHLRIIIDCNSKVPDRTKNVLNNGEDPFPYLEESARILENAGAELIVIPCNAAHYWHAEIQKCVSIPVLHIMEAAADYVTRELDNIKIIGLLAASSTVKVGLYQNTFKKKGIKVILPDQAYQEKAMEVIYGVKAGKTGADLKRIIIEAGEHLVSKGAQAVIEGCTEIPLVLSNGDLSAPVVDSTLALAAQAVKMARG